MTMVLFIGACTLSIGGTILLIDGIFRKIPSFVSVLLWIIKAPLLLSCLVIMILVLQGFSYFVIIPAAAIALVYYLEAVFLKRIKNNPWKFRFMLDLFLLFTPFVIITLLIAFKLLFFKMQP